MNSVATAVLKNKLSSYLARVRKGAHFIVTDHGQPVARLTPLARGEDTSNEEQLVEHVTSGQVLLPRSRKTSKLERFRPIKLGGDVASKLLDEMRDGK